MLGYFTICLKGVEINANGLPEQDRKWIKEKTSAWFNEENNSFVFSAFDICHIGRRIDVDTDDSGQKLTDTMLVSLVLAKIQKAQHYIGGNLVYTECPPDLAVIHVLQENHLTLCGERYSEMDDADYLQYFTLLPYSMNS